MSAFAQDCALLPAFRSKDCTIVAARAPGVFRLPIRSGARNALAVVHGRPRGSSLASVRW
eukprot:4600805-Lingulodinium_polyedra.AAC.1